MQQSNLNYWHVKICHDNQMVRVSDDGKVTGVSPTHCAIEYMQSWLNRSALLSFTEPV